MNRLRILNDAVISDHAVFFFDFMDVQIFFPGSETASDVSLGFVVFQNFLDLSRESGIYFKQPFGNILMYRRL